MTYLITTPLFYVNDLPHIGSAYPTMAADFFAGHMLQRGEQVCLLTGTDEHGQKIEKAAASNNKTPQEHCDFVAGEFEKLWEILGIHYHRFRRTSEIDHRDFVISFFKKVRDNGDIYKAKYKGLYCVSCEDFKLEKDLEESDGQLLCPVHKQKVETYFQENYFFALSKYEDKLKKHIELNPDFVCPEYRKNEVLGWINEGLKDFPISRVGIKWGIDVPDDQEGQKIYVWFDALLGYISGLGDDFRGKFWNGEKNEIVHIIGKDILRFHAVYWPAMLMSAGYRLPSKVFGHGFLTKDGMKMGKTLGNIIDPIALTKEFGADAIRFYFLREIVFGKDGDFTKESLINCLNSDLANNLGNLLNRSLNLVKKYFGGIIPDAGYDPVIKQIFVNLEKDFCELIDRMNPHQALDELFLSLNKVNAYMNDVAPWKLLKTINTQQQELIESDGQFATDLNLVKQCLFTALESCRRAAVLLAPLCPGISQKIFLQLGLATQAQLDGMSRDDLLRELFSWQPLENNSLRGILINDEIKPMFERIII